MNLISVGNIRTNVYLSRHENNIICMLFDYGCRVCGYSTVVLSSTWLSGWILTWNTNVRSQFGFVCFIFFFFFFISCFLFFNSMSDFYEWIINWLRWCGVRCTCMILGSMFAGHAIIENYSLKSTIYWIISMMILVDHCLYLCSFAHQVQICIPGRVLNSQTVGLLLSPRPATHTLLLPPKTKYHIYCTG